MSLPQSFPMRVADGKTIQIPSVGFGTWADAEPKWCKEAVLAALNAGYRHLDCAWAYGVDQPVGQAIRESGVPRSEIFITSKFWPNFARPGDIELCLDKILSGMGLDYIDLYLAHWPISMKSTSRQGLERAEAGHGRSLADRGIAADTDGNEIVELEHSCADVAAQKGVNGGYVENWKAMQSLVRSGKTRAIGVSNFSIAELEELLPHAKDIPISCNQIEAHPWLPNTQVIEFMRKHGIVATCYCPLGGPKAQGGAMREDAKVLDVAKRNGMGVGGVLQSWAVQRGTIPLGKSQSEDRIKSNLAIKKLPDEDMQTLSSLEMPGDDGRTCGTATGLMWSVKLYQN